MAEAKSIPADIFEEMAGMREITPPKSAASEENVKSETIVTPLDEGRLFKASVAFVSKVQKKLVKGFYKVAKRIVELQNEAAPKVPKKKGWNIFAKIIINETPAETSARETSESFNPFTLKLKLIWAGIKLAVGVLFALGKWIFKIAAKITTTILKLFGKIAKVVGRVFGKALRGIIRVITKVSKFVFKAVRKIVKAIWNIIRKLFFRGKPMPKQFKNEPSPKSMNQPALSKQKNKMKLKMKAPKTKSNFIMKAVKKVFKMLGKLLWKIVSKVFGKIIKKIIKVIVKMIIKFIAAQVIGSLLPGIGNFIMGAASMALMVMDVIGIVGFIKETSETVSELSEGFKVEPEEADDDEDGADIDEMNMTEVRKLMADLESQNKTNSEEYLEAKTRYLELLAEEYENSGDVDGAELIRVAMESGVIGGDLGAVPPPESEEASEAAIRNLDLNQLDRALKEHQARAAERKWENKRKNIFDESEMKTLLQGEVDKGPMWAAIWSDILWWVRNHLEIRFDRSKYWDICSDIMSPHIIDQVWHYDIKAQWRYETEDERNTRVAKGEARINEADDWRNVKNEEFKDKEKFADVIDKVEHYKFDVREESQEYSDSKSLEMYLQKTKLFKWEDVLDGLKTRNEIYKERYTEYVEPLLPVLSSIYMI